MKKFILSGLLMLSLFIPVFASALSVANLGVCVSLQNNLRYGSRDIFTNGEVTQLQIFLAGQNYFTVSATGFFGVRTLQAVKDFQRANSLVPDGRVGPITRAKISALTCGDIVATPGTLSINPANVSLKLGEAATLQAIYQPAWNCPDGRMCAAVMPAPEIVKATWKSSNTNIAAVEYQNTCPSGAYCLVGPDLTTAVVNTLGVGTATITASYQIPGGSTVKATAKVTVTLGGSMTQCEYANPPEGYHWEGMQPYPVCGGHLVADNSIVPVINSLSPTSGKVDTTVTITGRGFTRTGNKIKFGGQGSQYNPAYSLESEDGKTLVFTVPGSNYYACFNSEPSCKIVSLETGPGDYAVSVINDNGESNSMTFTVTR